jgi:BirA family biotin operon repressor/biotin-[acetyl-CoA-carboxylase] ligase
MPDISKMQAAMPDISKMQAAMPDISKMRASMPDISNSLPFAVEVYETLPSTNQQAWNAIAQGAKPGTVIIAEQQTSGRGQWGRQWSSPAGGLYLSVVLAPNLPVNCGYQLTLATAWGIATALGDRGIPVRLKWYNDLILSGRKLGGILTETKVRQEKIVHAVVGVGINWANPVPETGISLQSFLTQKSLFSINCLEMLAAVTLQGIASGYNLCSPAGINALLPSYHKLLINIGQRVTVEGRDGVVVGISDRGELRVRLYSQPSNNLTPISEICLPPGTVSLGYDG